MNRPRRTVRTLLLALAAAALALLATPIAMAASAADSAPVQPGPPPLEIAAPSRAGGATVARIVAPSFARARLDTPRRGRRVGTATAWSGQAQVLLVLDAATRDGVDWVKVLLPERPNGSAGEVPRDNVTLGFTRYWVEIGLRSRTVTVFRAGETGAPHPRRRRCAPGDADPARSGGGLRAQSAA